CGRRDRGSGCGSPCALLCNHLICLPEKRPGKQPDSANQQHCRREITAQCVMKSWLPLPADLTGTERASHSRNPGSPSHIPLREQGSARSHEEVGKRPRRSPGRSAAVAPPEARLYGRKPLHVARLE